MQDSEGHTVDCTPRDSDDTSDGGPNGPERGTLDPEQYFNDELDDDEKDDKEFNK